MKSKKEVITALVAGMLIGSVASVSAGMWVSAYRNDEVKVTLNGVQQTFRDETTGEVMYPLTYHDRTYLPLRNVANLAGLSVGYDAATKTAQLSTGSVPVNTTPTVTTPTVTTPTTPMTNDNKYTTVFNLGNDSYLNSLNLYRFTPNATEKGLGDIRAEGSSRMVVWLGVS